LLARRTMKNLLLALAAVLLLAAAATSAHAQVFTPTFMSPQRMEERGIYLNNGPGRFSMEGLWRRRFGTYDLGFRAGIADSRSAILIAGAELRTPLELPGAEVQAAITGGVQGAFGDGGAAALQAGLTLGYAIATPEFTLVPYVHPRLAIQSGFGRDGVDLDPLADIGLDVVLPQNLIARIAFGLGRRTADFGIGLSWR
jgi:hypothetical protein